MPFTKDTEQLLRALSAIRLENVLTGKLRRNSKDVSELIEPYLCLTPAKALEKARREREQAQRREQIASSDLSYWGEYIHRTYCEALVAVFEGVMRGKRKFPPLFNPRQKGMPIQPLDRMYFQDWAAEVRKKRSKKGAAKRKD